MPTTKPNIKITGLRSYFCQLGLDDLELTPGVYLLFRENKNDVLHYLDMNYDCKVTLIEPKIFVFFRNSFFEEARNTGGIKELIPIDKINFPINQELAINVLSEIKLGHLRDLSYIGMLSKLLATNLLNDQIHKNRVSCGFSIVHLETIQQFIHVNIHRHISLDELALSVQMNRNRFSKLFRLSFGSSPYNYINGMKMQQARSMLEIGESSVIQVGIQVGFDNPSHFSRVFKKHYGLSPKKYQRHSYQSIR